MKTQEHRDPQIPVCQLVEKHSTGPTAHKAIPSSSSCFQLKVHWYRQNARITFTHSSLKCTSNLLEPVTQNMISVDTVLTPLS